MIYQMNRKIEPQLKVFAKHQVTQAIHQLIYQIIEKIEIKSDEIMQIVYDDNGNAVTIDFNSKILNTVLYDTLNCIQLSLEAAENGQKDPLFNKIIFNNGIVYEVPLGYFLSSHFFSTKGPMLPVRMRTLNNISGDIKIKSEPYGYSNTMIKIMLVITLHVSVITVLSIEDIKVYKELPIVISVVQGKIPNVLVNKKEP